MTYYDFHIHFLGKIFINKETEKVHQRWEVWELLKDKILNEEKKNFPMLFTKSESLRKLFKNDEWINNIVKRYYYIEDKPGYIDGKLIYPSLYDYYIQKNDLLSIDDHVDYDNWYEKSRRLMPIKTKRK